MAINTTDSGEELLARTSREILPVEVIASSIPSLSSDIENALLRAQQWIFGVIPPSEKCGK